VNLRRLQASYVKDRGYRQLRQRAEPVKANPIATELADAISARRADEGLKWGHDSTLRVVLARVFSYGSAIMRICASI
jgi:hypothetical protein